MSNQGDAILKIYDAAIDDIRWTSALNESIKNIGCDGASLHMVDLGVQAPYAVDHLAGALTAFKGQKFHYYMTNLAALESEAWALLQVSPAREIIEDNEIWPDIQSVRMRDDYRYLEEHAGVFRRMIARLNDNQSWFDAIAFQFDSSITHIPAATKIAAAGLLPHIAKAFELSRTYRLLREQYQAVLGALNHVQIGICIALPDGTVIVKNDEAVRVLEQGDGLSLGNRGRLICQDPILQSKLNRGISNTALTAAGAAGASEFLLAVSRPSGQPPVLLEVSPLRDSLNELDRGLSGALVSIIDPERSSPIGSVRLATAYKLTDAESAVCRFLIDGWTNQDIADSRNVSIETVKSQVASISQKTGTRRRADLIRLAVKTSPPIGKSK